MKGNQLALIGVAALSVSAFAGYATGVIVHAQQTKLSTDGPSYMPTTIITPTGGNAPYTLHASRCDVLVNSSTQTSTFCPEASDPGSIADRTTPANSMTAGRSFSFDGGGTFTVPTGNLLTAYVKIMVGTSAVMTIQTPAAPVGSGGVAFHADCTVRSVATPTAATVNCVGQFDFLLTMAGAGVTVPFAQTGTFDSTVANKIDVVGYWNGTTTSQSTTVSQAIVRMNN